MSLSACASDSSSDANNNGGSNLALNTLRVKVDGTLMTYQVLSTVWSVPNNQIAINTSDPTDPYGQLRIFVNAPSGAKDYPVQYVEEDGKTRIQLTSRVSGDATTTFGHNGVFRITKLTDTEMSGTFNFVSSIAGSGVAPLVNGTDGEFRLAVTKI